jgi:hypothetical protein
LPNPVANSTPPVDAVVGARPAPLASDHAKVIRGLQ